MLANHSLFKEFLLFIKDPEIPEYIQNEKRDFDDAVSLLSLLFVVATCSQLFIDFIANLFDKGANIVVFNLNSTTQGYSTYWIALLLIVWAIFEEIIFRNWLVKENRRKYMRICLALAAQIYFLIRVQENLAFLVISVLFVLYLILLTFMLISKNTFGYKLEKIMVYGSSVFLSLELLTNYSNLWDYPAALGFHLYPILILMFGFTYIRTINGFYISIILRIMFGIFLFTYSLTYNSILTHDWRDWSSIGQIIMSTILTIVLLCFSKQALD